VPPHHLAAGAAKPFRRRCPRRRRPRAHRAPRAHRTHAARHSPNGFGCSVGGLAGGGFRCELEWRRPRRNEPRMPAVFRSGGESVPPGASEWSIDGGGEGDGERPVWRAAPDSKHPSRWRPISLPPSRSCPSLSSVLPSVIRLVDSCITVLPLHPSLRSPKIYPPHTNARSIRTLSPSPSAPDSYIQCISWSSVALAGRSHPFDLAVRISPRVRPSARDVATALGPAVDTCSSPARDQAAITSTCAETLCALGPMIVKTPRDNVLSHLHTTGHARSGAPSGHDHTHLRRNTLCFGICAVTVYTPSR
jgi:hypothetical protein